MTVRASEIRAEMEQQRDDVLALMDPEQICEECGRPNIDCTRDALTRNIDRAIERGRDAGIVV